jgi:peptidoglycan/LPS O-acetylase OafA/YrhL
VSALPSAKTSGGGRFGFLDAARGIAILAVLVQHLGEQASPAFRALTFSNFNFGTFGVILFFLISGFIIPFSLERSPSTVAFWISRVFRLYPLYLATLIFAVGSGLMLPQFIITNRLFFANIPANFLFSLTMVQSLLGRPDAIALFWTLAYEMIFYGSCTVLSRLAWRKRTDWVVWGFTAILAAFLARSVASQNYTIPFRVFWIGTFFVGTAVYRAWSGQVETRKIIASVGAFIGIMLITGLLGAYLFGSAPAPDAPTDRAEVTAWLAAYLAFGGLLRFSSFAYPNWLIYIGRISYSIYLLHGLLLTVRIGDPQIKAIAVLIATAILSPISFRFIEEPAIRYGKLLIARRALAKQG